MCKVAMGLNMYSEQCPLGGKMKVLHPPSLKVMGVCPLSNTTPLLIFLLPSFQCCLAYATDSSFFPISYWNVLERG